MSFGHSDVTGVERDRTGRRPLLPSSMSSALVASVSVAVGWVLMAVLAAVWASLISWSAADPSLSYATSTTTRNLMGGVGAMTADLLIQSLGCASLVILAAPMFWAMALVNGDEGHRHLLRIVSYVVSLPLLAAALGALPVPSGWPLHHGLGGVLGEAGLRLLLEPLSAVAPISSGLVRPVGASCLLLAGLACVWLSLTGHLFARLASNPSARGSTRVEPVISYPGASVGSPRIPPAQTKLSVAEQDEDAFDAWTVATSRSIAARFAPGEGRARSEPRFEEEAPREMIGSPALRFPDVVASLPTESPQHPAAVAAMEPTPMHAVKTGQDRPLYMSAPPAEVMSGARPAPRAAERAESRRIAPASHGYTRPSLNLLARPTTSRARADHAKALLRGNARLLEDVLADFGIVGKIRDVTAGPVVSTYELELARGTRIDRVAALGDEFAHAMGVPSVRIVALPGRTTLDIEMPNTVRQVVALRLCLEGEGYRSTLDRLPIALGCTTTGQPIIVDLATLPHLLVTGSAGTGKSTGINAMILSLLYRYGPEECRFLMIDPKMLDLSAYNGIPHLLTPVVTDPHKALTALTWCVNEMEERTKRMAALGVRTIDVFNNRVRNARKRGERLARTVQTGFDSRTGAATYEQEAVSFEVMPYIIIVMDEFADLMAIAGADVEGAVARLAVAARTAGIHLIIATERPSSDTLTASIKQALPTRMSYKTTTRAESRSAVGCDGSRALLGAGDLLYATSDQPLQRIHGPFVSSDEIDSVARCLRDQGPPRYIEGIVGRPGQTPDQDQGQDRSTAADADDELYDRAVALIAREATTSEASLIRKLNLSSAWARTLLARLEADGLIGPPTRTGTHAVLLGAAA